MSQNPDWFFELVERLGPNQSEDYFERLAIMLVDAKLPLEHAECLALLCILKNAPAALLPSYVEGKNISEGGRTK